MSKRRVLIITLIMLVIAFVYIVLQLGNIRPPHYSIVGSIKNSIVGSIKKRLEDHKLIREKLEKLSGPQLNDEKIRQEAIEASLKNERETWFLAIFIRDVGKVVTILVTLIGAVFAFLKYLRIRETERLDRATTELNQLWRGLASTDEAIVASSIAGFQHFLSKDNQEFHKRIVSGLVLASRLEDKTRIVRKTLRPIIGQALKSVDIKILRDVSWQGMNLHYVNFRDGKNLNNFDFHDSTLGSSNFKNLRLNNINFENAKLDGSSFKNAKLSNINFKNSDLTNTCFVGAKLTNCDLRNAKILGMDVKGAKFKDISSEMALKEIDWSLCKNWRETKSINNKTLRGQLFKKYGSPPENNFHETKNNLIKNFLLTHLCRKHTNHPRVLMIVWEYLPFVSGGGWTAAYHFIKNFIKLGCNIELLVPWSEDQIERPFGYEVKIHSAGIDGFHYSSSYSGYSIREASVTRQRSIIYQVNYFTNKVKQMFRDKAFPFDVIHAHDWLTFEAAKWLAEKYGKPWIAHFHSTEYDRRSDDERSSEIKRIEKLASISADTIIVPSNVLREKLTQVYELPETKVVNVIPNVLSETDVKLEKLGDFNAGRVVFVGRLTWQKGPDLFVEIASILRKKRPSTEFAMYGKGDERENIARLIEEKAPISWGKLPNFKWDEFGMNIKKIGYITQKWERLILTDQSLKELKEEIIDADMPYGPKDIIDLLEKLKNKEFLVKEKFLDELKKTIEKDNYITYKSLILNHAQDSKKQFGTITDLPYKHREYLAKRMCWESSKVLISPIQVNASYTHKIILKTYPYPIEKYFVEFDKDFLPGYEHDQNRFIVLKGSKEWEERASAFEKATVVVVPSRHEPFGMVVLEAMQHGVPVMYAKTAGIAQFIECGIPFDPNKRNKAAGLLFKLLEDETYWQDIVNKQSEEIKKYRDSKESEKSVKTVWSKVMKSDNYPRINCKSQDQI